MQILLAEDNPVNQKVALRMLKRIGHEAEVAGNGVEVLEALEKKRFDVILMDMQMPEMDGLEATRQIVEKYPEGVRPYIIALTANAMHGDRERCLAAGMNDYVSKPIRVEDLQHAFDRMPEIAPSDSEDGTEEELQEASADSVIDYNVLSELVVMLGNDLEFASGLIRDFLEDGTELMNNIRSAQEEGDASELERAAHTLKSSSATFGALAASDICKDIEEHGHKGELGNDTRQKIDLLETNLKAVSRELEAYIERQTA